MYKLLFDLYGVIPPSSLNRNNIFNSLYSLTRFVIRKLQSLILKIYAKKRKCYTDKYRVKNLIVSLTSFPKRLDTLWMTIESLKQQTIIPEKIVLYLINEEVSFDKLPKSLVNEIDDLFEIRFRDGKLRAHGKYHFAMKDFPDSCIVTVDDDMIYPYDTIEALWSAHKKYPDSVITNNTFQITTENKNIKPCSQWVNIFNCDRCVNMPNLIPMGVGGALYPPYILYKDILNFDIAKKLSYLADDLWLYTMTSLADKTVVKSKFNFLSIMPIDITNNETLTSINDGENQNDVQFKRLREYYIEEIGIDIVK